MSSAYGQLTGDLINAFHAEHASCQAATEAPNLCFEVAASGAGQLAEVLDSVVSDYHPAGLQRGAWRSENGVWAVGLYFGNGAQGTLELYLTEVRRGEVQGMLLLRSP